MNITMDVRGVVTFAAFAHLFVRGLGIGQKSELPLGRHDSSLEGFQHERMRTGMACFCDRA